MQELREFLPIIRRLAEDDGMSSDEQDVNDEYRFHSTRPFWRHSSITNWLHGIDSLGATALKRNVQREDIRQQSPKVDVLSPVVRGLPVNFYDWGYLSDLDRSSYLDLDPQPAIPLEFTALGPR